MSSYQIYTLAGDPATLGRVQAEQVRSLPHPIRAPRAPWADNEAFLERCAAELRAVAPTVWAEITAFAERVGIPPARGLFPRAGTLPHGCSAFAWRLADHSAPVCAHREYGSTLWSGVFDLTGRRAAYAFGTSCVAPFVERPFPGVAAEGEHPALLRAG